MSTPIARPSGKMRLAARSKSVPAPLPMSSTTELTSIGAMACGFPTPANDEMTSPGSRASSHGHIRASRLRRGPAVKMKLRVGRGGDPPVHRLNLAAEGCDVEFHRACQGHRSPPLTSNVTHARDVTRMLTAATPMVSAACGSGPDSADEAAWRAHLRARSETPQHAIRGSLRPAAVHGGDSSAAIRRHGLRRRSRGRGSTRRIPFPLAETEDGSASRRWERRWLRQYARRGIRWLDVRQE